VIVACVRFEIRQLVYGLKGPAFAKNRVSLIKMRSRVIGNKKLRSVGVGPSICHAKQARAIVVGTFPNFVRNHIPRLTGSCSRRIAALNHKTFNDAVKNGSVVGGLGNPRAFRIFPRAQAAGETHKVRDAERSLVFE